MESALQPCATRPRIASTAWPPNHALIPNQPAAMSARAKDGIWAPRVPNHRRANTGYGIPYLVPACDTRRIGTSTTQLPMRIVRTDSHQFMPSAIIPLASEYVGKHRHMPIQSDAYFGP